MSYEAQPLRKAISTFIRHYDLDVYALALIVGIIFGLAITN